MGNISFNPFQRPKKEKQSQSPSVHTSTNTHPRIDPIDKQKQTHTHSQAYTPKYTQYPFSQRLPVVNNKHADCLAAIKQPLHPFSFSLTAAARSHRRSPASKPAPSSPLRSFKSVGVARVHCLLQWGCYSRKANL